MSALVPGARYRADIGFRAERVIVEIDGFQHHGKYLADFKRDRIRQNRLTLQGWRVLRYAAGDIKVSLERCMEEIGLLVDGGHDGR